MVKIYSDKLNKFFSTVEEAQKAEAELVNQEAAAALRKAQKEKEEKEQKEKAAAERKALAVEVENARKECVKAEKVYREKLENFCKKYGTYHYSIENTEDIPSFLDFLGSIFKF